MIFLKPFCRAILVTQGDNATIDPVLFSKDILVQRSEKVLSDHVSDKELSSRITIGVKTFLPRNRQLTPFMRLLVFFIRIVGQSTFALIGSRTDKTLSDKKVREFEESYREKSPLLPFLRCQKRNLKTKILMNLIGFAHGLGRDARPTSQDGWEDYGNRELYSNIGQMSTLEWWCQGQQKEMLAKVVKYIIWQ